MILLGEKIMNSSTSFSRRNLILATSIIVIAAIVITVVFLMTRPERSVASFCNVAKREKLVLTGDVSYDKRLEAYKQLEMVSPDDIKSDITSIRKGYEDIVKNPSNTIAAGLGMSGAENRRTAYITSHCKDF